MSSGKGISAFRGKNTNGGALAVQKPAVVVRELEIALHYADCT